MKIIRNSLLAATLAGTVAFAPVTPVLAAPASDDAQAVMATAMGTLMAQGLLMTYTTIGAVADGFSKKAYSSKEATEVLDECQTTMNATQKALKKLLDSGALTDESDLRYLRQSVAAYDDLLEESADAKSCIQDFSQPNVKRFMRKKDDAWKKIKALLE